MLRLINQAKPKIINFTYGSTTVSFTPKPDVIICGSLDEAAIAVFNYMINGRDTYRKYCEVPSGMSFNRVSFTWDTEFSMTFIPFPDAPEPPPDFIKLKNRFDEIKYRLLNLKAFL